MPQIIKISDEGSTSPFIARLRFGLLLLRDQLFLLSAPNEEKENLRNLFDKKFQPMIEAAQATRDAAFEIRVQTVSHLNAIHSGQAVQFQPTQYTILETIDTSLGQSVDKLLDQSIVATKAGLQSMLRDLLGLDIAFFFKKDSEFNDGLTVLCSGGDSILAQYLKDVRLRWYSALQELRNQHQHHGWTLDRITYRLIGPSQVAVTLPEVLGSPIDIFARYTANRVLLFFENMMVFAMQRTCRFPLFAVEIPRERRDPANPQRFRFSSKGLDSSVPWVMTYRDDLDFL